MPGRRFTAGESTLLRTESIIRKLTEQKFIDDTRYAAAYVREKATLSRWGSYKIRSGLRTKQISEETIAEAVAQLDAHDMSGKLEEQLRRKMRTVKAKNSYDLRTKLLRYGAGLGFDFSEVNDLVERLIQHTDSVGDDFLAETDSGHCFKKSHGNHHINTRKHRPGTHMLRTGRQKERRRRTSQESRENVHAWNPDTPGGNPHAASSCRSRTKLRLKLGRKMEFDVGNFSIARDSA